MTPTRASLWVFRLVVLLGVAGVVYFGYSGARYFMWASGGALVLALFAIRASGGVAVRGPDADPLDPLSRALDGPHGFRIRVGLAILVGLLALLGLGFFEPARLGEWLLKVANAA